MRAKIGIIDLQDQNKWTETGKTTAWNWQQGNRLQWVPGSDSEIVWNDRADDGKSFVSRVYNVKTMKTRVPPRPIYVISPDGKTAWTHDFERMKHAGTNYVGIEGLGRQVYLDVGDIIDDPPRKSSNTE